MTVKHDTEPQDAAYQLIKEKRNIYHHEYITADTDQKRNFYKGKQHGLDLALTILKKHLQEQ